MALEPPPRALSDIVRDVEPSLVCVKTPTSSGSGFVVDYSGNVITNAHVVEHHANVMLEFVGGTAVAGVVLGVNPELDLACVRVIDAAAIAPATLGDSDVIQVGEDVLALGYPLQDILTGSPTVTRGIISAKRTDSLQTDAAINPGSSGGPLVNTLGHVIGVNTSVLNAVDGSSIEGIGFAIPINDVKAQLHSLASGSKPSKTAAAAIDSFNREKWKTYSPGTGDFSIRMPSSWTLNSFRHNAVALSCYGDDFFIHAAAVTPGASLLSFAEGDVAELRESVREWRQGVVTSHGWEAEPDGTNYYFISFRGDQGDGRGTITSRRELRLLSAATDRTYLLTAELSISSDSPYKDLSLSEVMASFIGTIQFVDPNRIG